MKKLINNLRVRLARRRFAKLFTKSEKDLLLRGLEKSIDAIVLANLPQHTTGEQAKNFYRNPPPELQVLRTLHEKIYTL